MQQDFAGEPARPPRTRWGLKETSPEPIDLEPEPSSIQRLMHSASSPIVAGLIVFAAVLAVVLAAVLLRSHSPDTHHDSVISGESSTDAWSVINLAEEEAETIVEPSSAPETVVVHVVGEVRDPGIVELAAESRVASAIEAAGGATESAVLAAVNLAKIVADGEQVVVPNTEQVAASDWLSPDQSSGSLDGRVNLNHADATALETLPRVGPALARRILDWRLNNGGFTDTEQLLEISGIGFKTFEGLRELVAV